MTHEDWVKAFMARGGLKDEQCGMYELTPPTPFTRPSSVIHFTFTYDEEMSFMFPSPLRVA